MTIDDIFINKLVELFIHQTCLKRVDKKILLGPSSRKFRQTPLQDGCLITFKEVFYKKPEVFSKKAIFKNLAILTSVEVSF